jgi:hypothetical protein
VSVLSNDFHAFLDGVKSTFSSLFTKTESEAEQLVTDIKPVLDDLVRNVPAVLLAAAQAAVTAALAASPGGAVASILTTAEAAAVHTVSQIGRPILHNDLLQIKTAVLNFFVAATKDAQAAAQPPAAPAS